MSLKRRISIAVAAIAVIHAAFYFVPRWWYSRPRVYPHDYEQAISLLAEEFGEAAVKKGVLSIPRAKIRLAYKGYGTTNLRRRWCRLAIHVDPRHSALFVKDESDRVSVAPIPCDSAREIWAVMSYLLLTEGTLRDRPERLVSGKIKDRLIDPSKREPPQKGLGRFRCAPGITPLIEEILERNDITFTSEKKTVARGIERLYGDLAAEDRTSGAASGFVRGAAEWLGADGKRLLVRICEEWRKKTRVAGFPQFFFKLPWIGAKLGDWHGQKRESAEMASIVVSELEDRIALADVLAKQNGEAVVAGLAEMANSNSDSTVPSDAAGILLLEHIQEWREYLIENHGRLTDSLKEDLYRASGGRSAVDGRLARLAAKDPSMSVRLAGLAWLYAFEGDAAALGELERAAASRSSEEAARALYSLASCCGDGRETKEVPDIARKALDAVSPKTQWFGLEAAFACAARVRSPEWLGFLEYALSRPPGTIPGPTPTGSFRLNMEPGRQWNPAWTHAAEALGAYREVRAVDALIAFIDQRREKGSADVLCYAARALGQMGDERALGALERLHATESGPRAGTVPEVAGVRRTLSFAQCVRSAILAIQFINAPDRVAWFKACGNADRNLLTTYSGILGDYLTDEQLQELLAADELAGDREAVFQTLYDRRELRRAPTGAGGSGDN